VDLSTGTITNDGFGNRETMTGIENVGAGTIFVDSFAGDDESNFIIVGPGETAVTNGGYSGIFASRKESGMARRRGNTVVDVFSAAQPTTKHAARGGGVGELRPREFGSGRLGAGSEPLSPASSKCLWS
jgi:hypothetical protein